MKNRKRFLEMILRLTGHSKLSQIRYQDKTEQENSQFYHLL